MMNKTIKLLAAFALIAALLQSTQAERDNDQDDFDDAGFDDSGYNSPQNHDAESSQHNPSNYSPANEEDIDDDDDVDESNNVMAKVAADPQPRRFYSSANSIVLPIPIGRQKRSLKIDDEQDIEGSSVSRGSNEPLIRTRRHLKKKKKHYIGPVYTYVKTDKHAHYKWGVKHKVGKHYG